MPYSPDEAKARQRDSSRKSLGWSIHLVKVKSARFIAFFFDRTPATSECENRTFQSGRIIALLADEERGEPRTLNFESRLPSSAHSDRTGESLIERSKKRSHSSERDLSNKAIDQILVLHIQTLH